jgi:hypothetical protein
MSTKARVPRETERIIPFLFISPHFLILLSTKAKAIQTGKKTKESQQGEISFFRADINIPIDGCTELRFTYIINNMRL